MDKDDAIDRIKEILSWKFAPYAKTEVESNRLKLVRINEVILLIDNVSYKSVINK